MTNNSAANLSDIGTPMVVAIVVSKSEAAADASVLSFTPPPLVGSYRIRFSMDVSAATAATLGWTATWTDSTTQPQSPTNVPLTDAAVAAPALTFVAVAHHHYYETLEIDTDNSGTAIVVKLTFAGTSFAAKVTVTIERIALFA